MRENQINAVDDTSTQLPDSTKSILCVEDDTISRKFLCQLISMKFPDQTILAAPHGQAGLDIFRKQPVDIVVTDIKMPVMDGISMAKEMRILHPGTCIIAISAHCNMDEQEGVNGIFSRCIRKPVDRKELSEALDDCVIRMRGGATDCNMC